MNISKRDERNEGTNTTTKSALRMTGVLGAALALAAVVTLPACSEESKSPDSNACVPTVTLAPSAASTDLLNRAYIASRDSGNVTIIDLKTLEVVGSLDTCSRGYHMVELSADFSKAYVSNTEGNTLDVLDVKTLAVTKQIAIAAHPTHVSSSRDGKLISVVAEGDNAVSFIDAAREIEVKRIPGFYTPHFVRYSLDNKHAYVANLGAHHLTQVNVDTLEIEGTIALDGFEGPAQETKGEGGFADSQIDKNGILWAAHAQTGKVLVYDTNTQTKIEEVEAGTNPWIVYAEHPFPMVEAHIVPNHGDQNVALLERKVLKPIKVMTGEPESYGVNYSSVAPDKAFVMNRMRKEIAVLNTLTKKIDATIDVGGNTETASTTADGRYVVATVSSANRVVIIDAATNAIVKTFDGIGNYPWTVTIPQGQNYCH